MASSSWQKYPKSASNGLQERFNAKGIKGRGGVVPPVTVPAAPTAGPGDHPSPGASRSARPRRVLIPFRRRLMFRQFAKRRVGVARRGLAAAVAGLLVAGTGVGVFSAARAAAPTGATGHIQTVAGNMQNYQQFGYSGDGGPAASAQLYNPRAIGFGP